MKHTQQAEQSIGTIVSCFLALLLLLGLTVGVSRFELGRWSFGVAVLIATAKGALIVLFFMRVKFSERLIWIFAGAGFYWLALFVGLVLSDYFTRNQ